LDRSPIDLTRSILPAAAPALPRSSLNFGTTAEERAARAEIENIVHLAGRTPPEMPFTPATPTRESPRKSLAPEQARDGAAGRTRKPGAEPGATSPSSDPCPSDGGDGLRSADGAQTDAAGAQIGTDTRRSPDALRQRELGKGKTDWSDTRWASYPTGLAQIARVQDSISLLAKESGYTVFNSTSRKATANRGAQDSFYCSYNAKPTVSSGAGLRKRAPKCIITAENRCCHVVTYEETTHGWFPLHGNLDHSKHPMNPIPELSAGDREATFTKYRAKIPDQLLDLANSEDVKDTKMSVEQLNQWLKIKATKLGFSLSWTYQDVYNSFATTAGERAHDATGMWEKLEQRRDEKGLHCALNLDKVTGRLDQVFFEMVSGWARLCALCAPLLCTRPACSHAQVQLLVRTGERLGPLAAQRRRQRGAL
jgi:hypothetical protein